jgi:hypothetical protein
MLHCRLATKKIDLNGRPNLVDAAWQPIRDHATLTEAGILTRFQMK